MTDPMRSRGVVGEASLKELRLLHAGEIAEVERAINEDGGEATVAEIIAQLVSRGWEPPEPDDEDEVPVEPISPEQMAKLRAWAADMDKQAAERTLEPELATLRAQLAAAEKRAEEAEKAKERDAAESLQAYMRAGLWLHQAEAERDTALAEVEALKADNAKLLQAVTAEDARVQAALAAKEEAEGKLYAAVQAGAQLDIWRGLDRERIAALEAGLRRIRRYALIAGRWPPSLANRCIEKIVRATERALLADKEGERG